MRNIMLKFVFSSRLVASLAVFLGILCVSVNPIDAKCSWFGFSVNDYGREGPERDSKQLLERHIKKWAQKRGVTRYRTGEVTVECKLFLDFILFDEYTCNAEAEVCWGKKS